nr:primosomal protein N' [Bacilli bacterium]
MYIDVLLQINAFDDKTFTYSVPSNLVEEVEIGKRVLVPFGKRKLKGIILKIKKRLDISYNIKDIISIIDEESLYNNEMITLGKYMSETYLSPLMSCYQAMIPSALKFNKKEIKIKYIKYIIKIKNYIPTLKSEINILNLFNKEKEVKKSNISNKKSLNNLIDLGILKEINKEEYRINKETKKQELNILTNKQKETYNYILNSNENVCLLRGITGSGKTEIYMHLIKDQLENNKTAIVLVPEISLTTQLIERFRNIFGNDIAVLHSSLSDGERYDEWRKIKRNEVKIVIGTRSAIFAPISNLGLIIIDEEQEDSYKQENVPRYKTIDIALKRSEYNNSKILLGSATPSLESYARSKVGLYDLVELTERINKKNLPKVLIIDMKDEIKKGNPILSKKAEELIYDRLNKREQIMILINRRGYSNYIICNECGNVIKCPNCDISLTYHKSTNTLNCHYCNHSENKPNICPNCGSKH